MFTRLDARYQVSKFIRLDFLTEQGKPLTSRAIQLVFKRLGKKIDLDGVRLSPHTLRHSFALAYIENGGDPFAVVTNAR